MDTKRIVLFILLVTTTEYVLATVYTCDPSVSCGCSSQTTTVTSKIVGGESASNNAWGWIVSLQEKNQHICGASLLNSEYAVTASHCIDTQIDTPSALRIVVGINYLNDQTSTTKQIRTVTKIINHPGYNNQSAVNDIAIIQFSSLNISSDSKLAFICLPNEGRDPFQTNTNLVAIGWGVTKEGSNKVSNSLLQVTVQAFADRSAECLRSGKTNSTTQFCAGVSAGGKDTCQGDSGGPLMAFENNRWILAGITSTGHGCAQAGYPGIYTRVSAYIPFLKENTYQTTTNNNTQNGGNGLAYCIFSILFWSLALVYASLFVFN